MNENPTNFFNQSLNGLRISRILWAMSQLQLADHLKNGPKKVEELSELTRTNPEALYRLLRTLAYLGLMAENPERRSFELTPLGAYLQSDHPSKFKDHFLLHCGNEFWQSWGELLYSLRTGETAFNQVYGMGIFEYLEVHPRTGSLFNRSFEASSTLSAKAYIEAYDFSGFTRVGDIGGGSGGFLVSILKQNPNMQGILFDLPEVVLDAPPVLEAAGVQERCEVIGGSFFEGIPGGCDAYTLKTIIHDWKDPEAILILKKCREVMNSTSKVLVIDQVLPERANNKDLPSRSILADLEMLVMAGGRERTESEFNHLFGAAGLSLSRLISIAGIGNIIEGVVV